MNGFARLVARFVIAYVATACNERPASSERPRNTSPAPESSVRRERARGSTGRPELVTGEMPVAEFVAESLATAPESTRTIVYAGAKWCEPCRRFHRALEAGELDERLKGFRFIDYDLDTAHDALVVAGYQSKLIPLFALPKSDGTASGRQIEGSVKGDGAVANILPRLLELTGPAGPAGDR